MKSAHHTLELQNQPIGPSFAHLRAALTSQAAQTDFLSGQIEALRAALRPLHFHFAKVHSTAPWRLAELLGPDNVDMGPLLAAVQALRPGSGQTVAYHRVSGAWAEPLQQAIGLMLIQYWVTNQAAAGSSRDPAQLLADPAHVAHYFGVPLAAGIDGGDEGGGQQLKKAEDADAKALLDATTFHISIPNYLHAVLLLCSELARLAFNSVTTAAQAQQAQANSDDPSQQNPAPFHLPLVINLFLKEVQAAFMSLNLQNDSLRRRYDALKYDVKSVEQIVYDLTLRGLV